MTSAREGSLGLGRAAVATVMFADGVGSSLLAEKVGDRSWIEHMDRYLQGVQAIDEGAGGTLVKSLGDGTVSSFTSTNASLTKAHEIW